LFAVSLLLFTLGVTTGVTALLYAGLVVFGVLVGGLVLRSASNVIDLLTSAVRWPSAKDD
jgi:hypothetical protein